MNLLGQDTKVKRHMAMLLIVLVLLSPFALFAALLLAAAVFSGSPPEGFVNWLAIIGLLGAPITMLIAGGFLLAGLREGFTGSVRRRLFGFYVCLLAYCGFWLAGSGVRDGIRFTFFDPPAVLVITLVVAIPSFATMFTRADP